ASTVLIEMFEMAVTVMKPPNMASDIPAPMVPNMERYGTTNEAAKPSAMLHASTTRRSGCLIRIRTAALICSKPREGRAARSIGSSKRASHPLHGLAPRAKRYSRLRFRQHFGQTERLYQPRVEGRDL